LQPCEHEADSDGSEITCPFPAADKLIPDELNEQLEQSESGTINSTEGPGVAVYVSSDGLTHADIYIGLELDGYTLYEDISSVDPNITVQLSSSPVIYCEYGAVDFDPVKDKLITVKVIGCSLSSICHKIRYK